MKKHLYAVALSFLSLIIFNGLHAQLNSVDVFGGMNMLTTSYYSKNPSPSGYSFGLRYNQHLSWELNGTAAVAMSKSSFYVATSEGENRSADQLINNSYIDLQFALQWQWLTEVRTRMAGGGRKQSCKGAKAIIFANFKSYLIAGIDYRVNTKSDPATDAKVGNVTNFIGGIGFDTYRLGRNAHHGSNAFVPFVEGYYMLNFGSPYATVSKTQLFMNGLNFRLGMKYTFGFKEKKFSW
jgi:hypothetical protein